MAAIVPDRGYQTGYATRRHPLAGEDAVSLLRTVEAPQRPVADLALARTARGPAARDPGPHGPNARGLRR